MSSAILAEADIRGRICRDENSVLQNIALFREFCTEEGCLDHSGLPGAGKDTWIKTKHPDLPVVSLDVLREAMDVDPTDNQGAVVQAAKVRARDFLRRREPFIWNATNISRMMRSQVLGLLMQYHARVRLVYVESNYASHSSQNSSRKAVVPQPVIERLLQRWDVPDLTEAHHVDYVIDG